MSKLIFLFLLIPTLAFGEMCSLQWGPPNYTPDARPLFYWSIFRYKVYSGEKLIRSVSRHHLHAKVECSKDLYVLADTLYGLLTVSNLRITQ